MAKKLEVRNLTISFRTNNGAVRAVRDISFDLEAGETLAIAGESGSGKSVTTRAVMGILAGNAMGEGGEIIYDGADLLKIPEEEFHTLRGHKLSMVFQDPLSALNTIMRIGKQLTEAMLLNNKERRADGKKRFNSMLQELEKNMIAARVQAGENESAVRADVKQKTHEFDSFVVKSVEMENAWKNAQESAIGMLDTLEEADLALLKQDARKVSEITTRLVHSSKEVYNPYLIPENDAAYTGAISALEKFTKNFSLHQEPEYRQAMNALKARLNQAVQTEESETPNFFRIGYLVTHGQTADPAREKVSSINERALSFMNQNFMDGFLADIRKAVEYSHAQSRKAMVDAVDVLEKELPVFEEAQLDEKRCRAATKHAADAVEHAIDRLALSKDSLAYVFRSSMMAGIDRYVYGTKHNPKEEKRYARETERHDRDVAAGKTVASVVPMNLVDLEKVRENLSTTVRNLIQHFRQDETVQDTQAQAVALVDYLKDRSSEYAYHLSKAMAKHRAIELMKEVGIPEPHKRFTQYPFEFSGGMRQRIVIAIALSANPDILICDEPTTALDVTIQAQILELINRLKRERHLSVIFITHDLGVVANMADKIAIMYAGKIVEYGTADDVFYDPRHPYTWALLASMPDLETKEKLEAIPGTPPNMILPPKGDAFAARNHYAMDIDFEQQPPMFQVSPTHYAATWLLHPNAPKVDPPAIVTERIRRMQRKEQEAALAAEKKGSGTL